MKLSISEKPKKDIFISIFQLLKNCSSIISILFNEDHMYIQGMDKSHVCLFDIKIFSSWFHSYEYTVGDIDKICIDTHILANVLSISQEHHSILLHYSGSEVDNIHIDLINTNNDSSKHKDFDKFFKLPLTDLDMDLLDIPNVDYDAEFSLPSKKICEIISQLMLFGESVNVKCCEEKIDLSSSGVCGEMTVNIPIDDLSEFSITEGDNIDLHYSLNYIHKMCLTNKLSSEIGISISLECPMRIKYDLGDNSYVAFFIAPQIKNE
jgi:proliferating cell nuclear antigen PCNA